MQDAGTRCRDHSSSEPHSNASCPSFRARRLTQLRADARGKIPGFALVPANAPYLSVYFPRNGRIG